MTSEVQMNCENGVMEICLNRPERKNALNLAMYQALASHFQNIRNQTAIRVVLLTGEGACFTSGNDLNDFASAPQEYDDKHPLIQFMLGLLDCPVPVVAAVEGVAVGIGTTMLLHCDFVYASAESVFQLPFVNLGLCPEYASSFLLPRIAGHVRAAEMLMLGEKFSAEFALECGMINGIYSSPRNKAMETCVKLSKQAPAAIRLTKKLLKSENAEDVLRVMMHESELFKARLQSPEFGEAVTAFFEKRPADFSKFEGEYND